MDGCPTCPFAPEGADRCNDSCRLFVRDGIRECAIALIAISLRGIANDLHAIARKVAPWELNG